MIDFINKCLLRTLSVGVIHALSRDKLQAEVFRLILYVTRLTGVALLPINSPCSP